MKREPIATVRDGLLLNVRRRRYDSARLVVIKSGCVYKGPTGTT